MRNCGLGFQEAGRPLLRPLDRAGGRDPRRLGGGGGYDLPQLRAPVQQVVTLYPDRRSGGVSTGNVRVQVSGHTVALDKLSLPLLLMHRAHWGLRRAVACCPGRGGLVRPVAFCNHCAIIASCARRCCSRALSAAPKAGGFQFVVGDQSHRAALGSVSKCML